MRIEVAIKNSAATYQVILLAATATTGAGAGAAANAIN